MRAGRRSIIWGAGGVSLLVAVGHSRRCGRTFVAVAAFADFARTVVLEPVSGKVLTEGPGAR